MLLLKQEKLLAFIREKFKFFLFFPLFLLIFIQIAGFASKADIQTFKAGIISSVTRFIQKNISDLISNSANADSSDKFSYINDAVFAKNDIEDGGDLFFEDIGIITVQNDSIAVSLNSLSEEISREKVTIYEVQKGDTPSDIAKRFDISLNTLLWANDLSNPNLIKIGDKLIILPVTGVKHTVKKGDTLSAIAKKYKGDVADIIAFNNLPADGSLQIGQEIIVPDGIMPVRIYVQKDKKGKIYTRRMFYSNLPDLGEYFIMPTLWDASIIGSATHISQGFHGKNAVDIANKNCGRVPIYAAAEGMVLIADGYGYNGGYGKFIVIEHPNKTQTVYAHNSRLFVSSGQYVSQGQEIALMGSTGRSTGCHLHFEVHSARNPFIKY